MKLFDLNGRVAVVTGGNAGIGFGIAQGLAEAGAAIVIAGRRADKNAEAVKALTARGASAVAVEADMEDEGSCRALIAQAVERLGRLDILVNNAGTTIRKQPEDYTLAEWRRVIDVNLTGAFVCTQAAYPHMVRAGGGKIVNIGSMMSIFGASFAGRLRRQQGRHRADDQGDGLRLGQGQHPGERDPAGLDRHRPHPHRAASGARSQRARARAHAGRTLGQPRRSLRDRRVPRQRRLRFRDRDRDPGRRRLFLADLTARSAEFPALPVGDLGGVSAESENSNGT